MIYEAIVTSAERGVQPGRSGFQTVYRTHGMHPQLGSQLEVASGYRHVYSQGDSRNPQILAHRILQFSIGSGSQTVSVLSQIVDAGNDYSNRSNKLAHHIVLDAADVAARAKSSPATVLADLRRAEAFKKQWLGEPGETRGQPRVPINSVDPAECAKWKSAAGDGGWAGFLVDRALAKMPTWIIAPPGVDLVELFAEAMALVNYPQRWGISFTTYAMTAGDALWLGTVDGSPEAQTARGQQRIAVIDLARRPPLTAQSPTIEAARGTGQVPWKRDASRPAAAVVAPTVGPAASGPTLGGPTIGQPLGGPAAHSHFGPPTTVPPPIGGGPGAPPPIGGRGPGGPPMLDPLGRPVASAGWGGSGADGAYVPEPVGRSARNPMPVYALVGVVLAAVLIGIVAGVPSVREQVLALAGGSGGPGGGSEEVAVRPEANEKPPVKPAKREPESASDGEPKPQPEERSKPATEPDGSGKPAGVKQPQIPDKTPEQKAADEEMRKKVQWLAFHAERAKLGGRYPLESLDGEKAEAHKAKICEVGDMEFELLLPTTPIVQGIDVWRLVCSRPDKAKRAWVFACESWPEVRPTEIKKDPLGTARVEDDGCLVFDLEVRSDSPTVRAAREALTCGPLTLETPLRLNDAPDQRQSFVQLRRPAEYGPLRIEQFFANRAIWPKSNPRQGKWPLGEFVPIPGVPVPANPWHFRLEVGKTALTLKGDGDSHPIVQDVQPTDGSFGVGDRSQSCTAIFWQCSFSREPQARFDLIRTDMQFQRVQESGAEVLGVRISDARNDDPAIMEYDWLESLGNAPKIRHESIKEKMQASEFFPITEKKVKDFISSHLQKVPYKSMAMFIQAFLPKVAQFSNESNRTKVWGEQKGSRNELDLKAMSLEQWAIELQEFMTSFRLYREWCDNPPLGNPPPPQPPPDQRERVNWQKQVDAWNAAKKAFDKRFEDNRKKPGEFRVWLESRAAGPDSGNSAAVLQAVCTAIEKIPTVVTGKQEVIALLKSMQIADLEMTGSLVVWPPNEQEKQCVLATFTAGKEPVVVPSIDGRNARDVPHQKSAVADRSEK
jgi:hypothetical protein